VEFVLKSDPLSNFVFSRLFVVLVFVLAISCPLNALNATVCDCSEATNFGFLRFPDEECSYQSTKEPSMSVEFVLYSTMPKNVNKSARETFCRAYLLNVGINNNNSVQRLLPVECGYPQSKTYPCRRRCVPPHEIHPNLPW
jgi:hypothetical protein